MHTAQREPRSRPNRVSRTHRSQPPSPPRPRTRPQQLHDQDRVELALVVEHEHAPPHRPQVLRARHDSTRRCRPARALDPRRPRRRCRLARVASDAGGRHPPRLPCPRPSRRRTPPCARARAAPGSPGIPAPKHRPTAALRPRAQSTLRRDRHRVADRLEERHVLVAIAVANDRSRSRPCSSASAAPPAPSPPPTTARPPGGRSVTIPVIVR